MIYTKEGMLGEMLLRTSSCRFESLIRNYALVKIRDTFFFTVNNKALWMSKDFEVKTFLDILPEETKWKDIPVKEVNFDVAVKAYAEGKDFEFHSESKTYCYQRGQRVLGLFENGMSGFDRTDLTTVFLVQEKDEYQKIYEKIETTLEHNYMNPDFTYDGPHHDVTKIYKVTC